MIPKLIKKEGGDNGIRVRVIPIAESHSISPTSPQNLDIAKHIGEPTWPERWSIDGKSPSITEKYRTMWTPNELAMAFLAEYLCEPFSTSFSIFKKEYFQNVSWEELRKKQVVAYVTLDTPSRKEGEIELLGDFCGFCINFVDKENKWHLKAWKERLGPSEIIKKIFDLDKWLSDIGIPVLRWGWEDTAFTRGLELAFREEKVKRNVFIVMEWLRHGGVNKQDRIRSSLLGRYEARNIFHLTGECNDLESEALRFPTGETDDCLDSTAYQTQIVKPFSEDRLKKKRSNVPNKDEYRSAYEDEEDESGRFGAIGL